ncbi:unnamed protein product [Rhizopus microsporus]
MVGRIPRPIEVWFIKCTCLCTYLLYRYWIGNNPNVVERFIMTLNIIMHSSTNTPDKRRIVREYFEFAFSMRYFQATQCQKALLLGIETILNVSYKGQESLLFNDFMSELINTKEWLEEIIHSSVEDKIQMLAAKILLRLAEINKEQLLT